MKTIIWDSNVVLWLDRNFLWSLIFRTLIKQEQFLKCLLTNFKQSDSADERSSWLTRLLHFPSCFFFFSTRTRMKFLLSRDLLCAGLLNISATWDLSFGIIVFSHTYLCQRAELGDVLYNLFKEGRVVTGSKSSFALKHQSLVNFPPYLLQDFSYRCCLICDLWKFPPLLHHVFCGVIHQVILSLYHWWQVYCLSVSHPSSRGRCFLLVVLRRRTNQFPVWLHCQRHQPQQSPARPAPSAARWALRHGYKILLTNTYRLCLCWPYKAEEALPTDEPGCAARTQSTTSVCDMWLPLQRFTACLMCTSSICARRHHNGNTTYLKPRGVTLRLERSCLCVWLVHFCNVLLISQALLGPQIWNRW